MDAQSQSSSLPDQPLCGLVQKMLNGSDGAAWQLAEEISGYVRRVARRHSHANLRRFFDSDDYVQNVWASVFRIAPKLRDVRTDEELLTLIGSMTKNRVIDQTRRHTRTLRRDVTRTVSLSSATTNAVASDQRSGKRPPRPSELYSVREKWNEINRQLSPVYRRIATLRLKGHTYEEIAEQLSISKRTVTRAVDRISKLAEIDPSGD